MNIEIRDEQLSSLADYARVSIAFEVSRAFDVELVDGGLGGFALQERAVRSPYVKDYDAIDGAGPTRWTERYDTSTWGLIAAHANHEIIGGTVIAFDTPGVQMLEGRPDLAVVWDLRIEPEWRRKGIGSSLFSAAEAWAVKRGCRWLKVETQNVNVPACRCYAKAGCVLGAIDRFAYPELPDEVQLLWYKSLSSQA